MNLLITGGLGVNGTWVIRKLMARGYTPLVLDNRRDFSLIPDLKGEFEVIDASVNDVALLTRIFQERKIQRVLHLAALMPPAIQENPLNGVMINDLATAQVLEAARVAGVERVVFTSSKAYYGEVWGAEYGHPTYKPVPETHPIQPITIYDSTKVNSEIVGQHYQRSYGLEFVALRFGTIYGPGKLTRLRNIAVYAKLVENPLAGKPVRIAQGRDQGDDMVYVDDVAEGIVLATLKDKPRYSAYNIATGKARPLEDYANAVRQVIPGADIEIGLGLDYFQVGVNWYCALDITRAREDLGYAPQYSYEAGVRHYVESMQKLGIPPVISD